MTEISSELARKLSTAVEKMPAFPKSVQRVLEITRDINCKPKELVMVIEKDPVMTIKLLRILNSAYYSFPNPITSVHQSVVYLGINTIKNMALSFATAGILPPQNDAGFDIQRYLMHSLTTASLARMLCQKFSDGATDPTDCHIAGLLHDFGKVVFAQFMPTEFKEALTLSEEQTISLHATEKHVIGADHSIVGAMLVEKWQFPKMLSDTIRHHHSDISPENRVQCYLFVADQISKKLSLGNSGNLVVEELPPVLIKRFGSNMDDIIVRLGDLSKLVEEAESFTKGSSEDRNED
jgi:putative nucleotidyltransferase with HDIG domain